MCNKKLLSTRWNTISHTQQCTLVKSFSHSNFSQDLLSECVSGYTGNSSMPISEKKSNSQPNVQLIPVITPITLNCLVGKKTPFICSG